MNQRFRAHVESLEPKLQGLVSMSPIKVGDLPETMAKSGIYLLSEGTRHLYVGRSKRLRHRLRYHSSDRYLEASFAFVLAREATGFTKATYKKAGSRAELQANPIFQAAFRAASERIRGMGIRFVEENDPIRQALLEIYAAISLGTPYNKFETT